MYFQSHTIETKDNLGRVTESKSVMHNYSKEEIEAFGWEQKNPEVVMERQTEDNQTEVMIGFWHEGEPLDLSFVMRGPK